MIVALQHRSSEIAADCLRLIYVQRYSSRSWTSVIHVLNNLNKYKRWTHFADTKKEHLNYINLLYFHLSHHCCKTILLLNSIIRGSSFFFFFHLGVADGSSLLICYFSCRSKFLSFTKVSFIRVLTREGPLIVSLFTIKSHTDCCHKWRPRYYSFVFLLIILTSLIAKILLNFVRANEASEND